MMTSSITIARIRGIDIGINWSWLAIVGLPLLLTLGLIVVVSRRLGQALRQGGEAEAGTP